VGCCAQKREAPKPRSRGPDDLKKTTNGGIVELKRKRGRRSFSVNLPNQKSEGGRGGEGEEHLPESGFEGGPNGHQQGGGRRAEESGEILPLSIRSAVGWH